MAASIISRKRFLIFNYYKYYFDFVKYARVIFKNFEVTLYKIQLLKMALGIKKSQLCAGSF